MNQQTILFDDLIKAIENSDNKVIKSLLERTKTYQYFHMLHTNVMLELMKYGDTELIQFAVGCGAHLDYPLSGRLKRTLHIAAELNKPKMVSFLINEGINPDVLDSDHNTPLFFAAASGSREAIEFLIRYNANINHSNIFGKTPLMEAVNSGNKDIVSLLLNNEANPNIQDRDGTTALMLTQINARENARKYIVGHSIDNIDYSHASKKQKLENPFEEIIRKLLSCGASIFLENKKGNTVLNLALPYFYEIIRDALSAVNITDKFLESTHNPSENEGLQTPNISELLNVIEKGVTGDALTAADIDSLKNNGLEEALYGFLEDIKQASEKDSTTIKNERPTIDDDFKIDFPTDNNDFFKSLSNLLSIDQMTIRSNIDNFIATHPEIYSDSIIATNILEPAESIKIDRGWLPYLYVSAAATALQNSIIIHLPNGITYDIITTQTSKALHLLYKETKYTPLIMEERRKETNSHSL